MTKRVRPTILVDEHTPPPVVEDVEELGWFRVLRASHDRRFRGRDEQRYLPELRSMNIMFLTRDGSFVRTVIWERVPHAGILWLPVGWSDDEVAPAVSAACGIVRKFLDDGGVHGMRDVVVRVDDDGIHAILDGRDQLVLSPRALEFSADEYLNRGGF